MTKKRIEEIILHVNSNNDSFTHAPKHATAICGTFIPVNFFNKDDIVKYTGDSMGYMPGKIEKGMCGVVEELFEEKIKVRFFDYENVSVFYEAKLFEIVGKWDKKSVSWNDLKQKHGKGSPFQQILEKYNIKR